MLKIFVCDDEQAVAQQIHNYITGYYINHPREYEVKLFTSGLALFEEAKNRTADVIFLDIDLKDSNGIKIAKAIRRFDKQVKIVFITSHKNFKGAAFSVRAFGYVDKPVTSKQLFEQLSDIETYMRDEKSAALHKFDTTEGMMHIPLQDILYFATESRKVKITTFNGTHLIRQKIAALEAQLREHNFASPHVSFLVNLEYVVDCKNHTVHMADGAQIPLSQRKSTEFRKANDAFLAHSVVLGRGE